MADPSVPPSIEAPQLRLCPQCGRPNQPERADHDREMGYGEQCRCTMFDIVGGPEEWLAEIEESEVDEW